MKNLWLDATVILHLYKTNICNCIGFYLVVLKNKKKNLYL